MEPKVEINFEALMQEASNNLATLNSRCMMLAGQNGALTQQVKVLTEENSKLKEQNK